MSQANAITAIAYRDLLKLLRDPARMVSTFIFPFIFIAVLGGSMQAALGEAVGFNLLTATFTGVLAMMPVAVVICLFGGAFGVIILANLKRHRAANQIFPFVMLHQLLIAGVIAHAINLPPYLEIISRIAPLRYAVDLLRGVFYEGTPEYDRVVLDPPGFNLAVMAAMFAGFLALGTWLFVSGERNW